MNAGNRPLWRVVDPVTGDLFIVTKEDGGDSVVVKTYNRVWCWWRPAGAPLSEAFDTEVCPAPAASEPQGEAVGFARDSLGDFTVSEGAHPPVYWFAPVP